MEQNLVNRLQKIKEHEQAIKEQKDFIRASLIASIRNMKVPSVKKVGSILNVIAYKDLDRCSWRDFREFSLYVYRAKSIMCSIESY